MDFNNTFKTYDFGFRGEIKSARSNTDASYPFYMVALYDGNYDKLNSSLGLSYNGITNIFGVGNTNITKEGISANSSIIFTLCESIDDSNRRVVNFSSDYEDIFEMNVMSFKNGGMVQLKKEHINQNTMSLTYSSIINNNTLRSDTQHNHIADISLSGQNNLKNVDSNISRSTIINNFSSSEYNLDPVNDSYASVPYDWIDDVSWVFKKTIKTGFVDGYIETQKYTNESFPLNYNGPAAVNQNYIPNDIQLAYYLNYDSKQELLDSITAGLSLNNDDSFNTEIKTKITDLENANNVDILNQLVNNDIFTNGASISILREVRRQYDSNALFYNSYYNFFGGNLEGTSYTNPYNISQKPGGIYKGENFNTIFGASINTYVGTTGTLDKKTSRPIFIPTLKRYKSIINTQTNNIEFYDKYNSGLSSGNSIFWFSNSNMYTNVNGVSTKMSELPNNGFLGISYKDLPDVTYTVTVANPGTGNKYYIDNVETPTLTLEKNRTYIFDLSDATNNNHPMKFSTTQHGSHDSGSTYSIGINYNINGVNQTEGEYINQFSNATSRQIIITVSSSAPTTLYYFCHYHNEMGGNGQLDITDSGNSSKKYINYYYNKINSATGQSIHLHFDKSFGNNYSGVSFRYNEDFTMFFFKPSKSRDYFSVTEAGLSMSELKDHLKLYLIPSSKFSYIANQQISLQRNLVKKDNFINYSNGNGAIFHTVKSQETSMGHSTSAKHTATHNSFYTSLLRRNNGLGNYWATNSDLNVNFSVNYKDVNSFENYIIQDNNTTYLKLNNGERKNIPLFFTNVVDSMHGVFYRYCKNNEFCGTHFCMGAVDNSLISSNDIDISREYNLDISKCVISATANKNSPNNNPSTGAFLTQPTNQDELVQPTKNEVHNYNHGTSNDIETIVIIIVGALLFCIMVTIFISSYKKGSTYVK